MLTPVVLSFRMPTIVEKGAVMVSLGDISTSLVRKTVLSLCLWTSWLVSHPTQVNSLSCLRAVPQLLILDLTQAECRVVPLLPSTHLLSKPLSLISHLKLVIVCLFSTRRKFQFSEQFVVLGLTS